MFWNEVEKIRTLARDSEVPFEQAKVLYSDFVKPMAVMEVNISGKTRAKITEQVEGNILSHDMFDEAQTQVYSLMHRQSYPRFLVSDLFKCALEKSHSNDEALTNNSMM